MGIPIDLRRTSPKAWYGILDNIKTKLVNWGVSWINSVGRTIFVEVVLSVIPLYEFSALLAPRYVMQQPGGYIRKFMWEEAKQEKKIHLVNWKTVRAPKKHGGHGI